MFDLRLNDDGQIELADIGEATPVGRRHSTSVLVVGVPDPIDDVQRRQANDGNIARGGRCGRNVGQRGATGAVIGKPASRAAVPDVV